MADLEQQPGFLANLLKSIDPVSAALTILPTIGGFLTGSDQGVNDDLLRELTALAREGVGVEKLARPAVGAVNASAGHAMTEQNKSLARTGMSNTGAGVGATQNLFQKRAGELGNVYDQANARNEQIKQGARDQLMRLLGMRFEQSPGESLGNLAGVGMEGLLRSYYNSNPANTGGSGVDNQLNNEIRKAYLTPTRLNY